MGLEKRRRDSFSPEESRHEQPETKKARVDEPKASPRRQTNLHSAYSLEERKIYVLSDRLHPNELARVKRAVDKVQREAADGKYSDECWPHRMWVVNPKHSDFKTKNLSRAFAFIHRNGVRLSVSFNHGTWVKLLDYSLTEEEKNGITYGTPIPSKEGRNELWELSHFCGNWMCVNPEHAVLEPQSRNTERKSCHRNKCCKSDSNGGDTHSPACIVGVQLKDPSRRRTKPGPNFSLTEESEVPGSSQESIE